MRTTGPQPPSKVTLDDICFDRHALTTLLANMLEVFPAADDLSCDEDAYDGVKDHLSASTEVSLYLSPSILDGPGAPPSGEHAAAVCLAGPSDIVRMGTNKDPCSRPGFGNLRSSNVGPRRLQVLSGRRPHGTSRCRVCSGSITIGSFQRRLASSYRTLFTYQYSDYRRRRLLRSVGFQRPPAPRAQRHHERSRTPLYVRASMAESVTRRKRESFVYLFLWGFVTTIEARLSWTRMPRFVPR